MPSFDYKYSYNLYNLISIRSAIDISDVLVPLDIFSIKGRTLEYDLSIGLISTPDMPSGLQQIAPGLYYSQEKRRIASLLHIFGIPLYWEIRNLFQENTELLLNRGYLFFFKHIFEFPLSSVFQPVILIKMILQLKFLQKNRSLLVGSSAVVDQNCVILSGMCGSGKTRSISKFMQEYSKALYLSDDLLLLSDDTIYGFPSPIRTRKANINFRFLMKFENPAEKYKERFLSSFKGKKEVYFLETSAASFIRKIESREGISKLCAINNRVFLYSTERLLSSYPYLDQSYSLFELQRKQYDIFASSFKDANFYILSSRSPEESANLLKNDLKI